MKLKRIRLASTIMCFAVASAAILGGIGMQSASAGITSNIVLESAGLAGTLSPGMFVFDGDDDVSATSDNVISFGSQNTVSETQLMLRSKLSMYSSDGAVSFADMDLSVDLINIPQGAAKSRVFCCRLQARGCRNNVCRKQRQGSLSPKHSPYFPPKQGRALSGAAPVLAFYYEKTPFHLGSKLGGG